MATNNALDISDLPAPDDISDLPAPVASTASKAAPNYELYRNPVSEWTSGFFNRSVSSFGGAAAGGTRALWDLALGKGTDQAVADLQATQGATNEAVTPKSGAGQMGASAAESSWNPLNWPGIALSWAGKKLGGASERLGGSPALSATLETAPTAVAMLAPVVRGMTKADWSPYRVAAEEAPPGGPGGSAQSISAAAADGGAAPSGVEPLGAPIEGGLPESAQDARSATLARVGIENARESAITGDAKSAAVDYQMSKYDQPAGRAAAAQFQSEREALAAHAEKLITDNRGSVGMDEDTLSSRGSVMHEPFGMLRDWFSQRMRQLYTEADQKSAAGAGTYYEPGKGTALTNLESLDKLSADPTFQNTLAAKNQQGLLSAVQRQLQFFRENNPNGFSAAGAEQVRQWLNQIWTPDNKWAIGRFKDAIDNDVTSAAGEDIYAQARAIKQLQARTFDTPGVSELFEIDPKTGDPIVDPAQLPDKLTRLPPGKFANVLSTLQQMPEELQPASQAAIGEIKGHLLNKLLQAGTQTSRGVGAEVWGTDRVAQVLRTNALKFRTAFADDPETQAGIEDLSNAGQILRVNQGYPGADAQAANAMKRGLISRTLGHLGGSAGAAAGAAVAGPLGAAAGGAAGESLGLSAGARASERAALKSWNKRVRPTEAP